MSETLRGAPPLKQLRDATGRAWVEHRATLVPRYDRAWVEIAGWYAAMMATLAGGFAAAAVFAWPLQLAMVVPSALVFGSAVHAFTLFGHEAAHYNLARNRRHNDRLSDWLLLSWTGQSTKAYRRFHWQHHLHLGGHADTEISYHECASLFFLVRLLTGAYLFEALLRYGRKRDTVARAAPVQLPSLVRFALLNGAVVLPALVMGAWAVALAWVTGLLLVFPALNSLRQMLEHRHEAATCESDVTSLPPVTFDFGDGIVARILGPAGFRRHMLHHWDPTVSYTNFPEMESFLRRTEMTAQMDMHRRSYGRALLAALRRARVAG